MNGSKGTATTVMTNLPSYVKPYIFSGAGGAASNVEYGVHGYLPWAERLFEEKNPELWRYNDDTYASQDGYEISAINKLANRGRNGDSLIKNNAIPYIEGVLDGNYLTGTKAEFITMLDKVIDKPKETIEDILDEIGISLYVMGDLSNSNLAKESVDETKYYDRMGAFIKVQNYKSERRRQEHALGYGIEYGKQDVVDAEILRMSGLYFREYEQGRLSDVYKKEYDKLVTKVRRLEILGNAVRSLVGSQSAKTEPYYRASPIVGILGGAMTGAVSGAMLASSLMAEGAKIGGMGAGAFGAIAGAGVGALLGFLSSG